MSALAAPPAPPGTLRALAERVAALADPDAAVTAGPAAAPPAGPGAAPPDADDVRAHRGAWYAALEDAVLALSDALPEGAEDYDARKLLEFLVALRRAIDADADGRDARGEVALRTLMVRDAVRRIARRLAHDALDDPRAAVDFVFATLRGVGASDLARLLGVSTKTIGAWRAGRPVTRNADRAVVVAQVLTYLRASLTPQGLVMWFDAERDQLGGRSPLALLDAGPARAVEPLVALARGARGQLAG